MTELQEDNGTKKIFNFWLHSLSMDPFVKIYFGLLFISPFLALAIRKYLNVQPYYVLGSIAVILAIFLVIQKNLRIPKYIYPLVLFLIYNIIWDFFNGRYEQFGILKLLFKNYSLHIIAIIIIIENINITDKFIRITIKIFKLIAIVSFVVAIYQFLFNNYFFVPEETITIAKSENYFGNVSIWGYLNLMDIGLSLLPILAIIINNDLLKKKINQAFLWLGIAGIVAFLTYARWTMINFFLLLLLPIFFIQGSKVKNIILSIVSSAIIIFILIGAFNASGDNFKKFYNDRILSKSAETRVLAFKFFSEFFPKNPILGSGVRVNDDLRVALAHRSSQIHVGYLSSLYEYGIIGSLFLFTFWFLVARKFYKNSKISKQYGIFIGFLCFLFANLTLVEYSMFHIGIIFLFVFNRFYKLKFLNHLLIQQNKDF